MREPRMHAHVVHAIALVASVAITPLAAHGQTVGGEIVGLESGKPVHGASVALVDDSANIVSSTAADTVNGMFYVDAPHAGHYRVVLFANGGSFVSPAMQVDSGQTVERKFSVPDVPGAFRNAYFAQDVTDPAQLLSINPNQSEALYQYGVIKVQQGKLDDARGYPRSAEGTGQSALVVLMFVVDEHGRVDPGSVQVINDTKYDFARAARAGIANAVYRPAVKDGASVRQVTQLSIGFGVPGNVPVADLRITSLAGGKPVSNIGIKDSVIEVRVPGNGASQLQPGGHP